MLLALLHCINYLRDSLSAPGSVSSHSLPHANALSQPTARANLNVVYGCDPVVTVAQSRPGPLAQSVVYQGSTAVHSISFCKVVSP
eukprot:3572550-Rhodomonas_salina.1